ncbi:MAG: hypothetical protein ABJ000_03770 [Saccharospirillum sp.]|uniref:hypothetical protein n=1 Tax=Saccharospirillum sp. TaxID=2033801 RepID=UPI0032969D11
MAVIDTVKHLVLSRWSGVFHLGLFALLLSLAGCMSPQGFSQGDVMLYWETPQERINGDTLPPEELGGYEIRYRQANDNRFTVVLIRDNDTDQYLLKDVRNPESAIIEVAAFDHEGIYSNWVRAR